MYYKNTDQFGRGRPISGAEKRSVTINIRIEPYLNEKLDYICKLLGVSKSEAIRQGMMLYLNEAEKRIKAHYE